MRNDGQKVQGEVQRIGKGGGLCKAISGYLRIVSSGASTVASSVKSAGLSVASALADDDAARDQVQWSGFDKLEGEGNLLREVLLLGYRSGFEVWDVEEADNVHQLASRRDGPVSFLQVQKKPTASCCSEDKFQDVRPLLAVAGVNSGVSDGYNSSPGGQLDQGIENVVSTNVQFYSLRSHSYVHVLKFRSGIYAVRCSPRVVAILQASQIHCFDSATLEREYTILTYPFAPSSLGSWGIGYGPLAVGARWLAYSGIPVNVSGADRVSPQHVNSVNTLSSSPSNRSLVAQYAKESSKQLASGIVTIGDMGYKRLSKYCTELLQDGNSHSPRQGICNSKSNGTIDNHQLDMENAGMVIVRDLISKTVVVQFRAHTSPISALCFDPSGTLLVTASIHGHNINIFRMFPPHAGIPPGSDACGSYAHLYRLQRGFTDAVIQDISFSDDSQYIMISSSRGTSHLFAPSPLGRRTNLHLNRANFTKNTGSSNSFSSTPKLNSCSDTLFQSGAPITLSVVSRIRNGANGWKGAVSGAAAAAAGKVSTVSGATSSVFHHCKGGGGAPAGLDSPRVKYLLVFSPSGCLVQYLFHQSSQTDGTNEAVGLNHVSHEIPQDTNSRLVVEAVQKWDVCHKRCRRDHVSSFDVYGENGSIDGTRSIPKATKRGTSIYPTDGNQACVPKFSTEESHHAYISAVELNTHASKVLLWTRPQMCFQAISDDLKEMESRSLEGGEIEIEKIPTCIIEVSSKTLIPALDNLHIPGFQQSRSNNDENNGNGSMSWQKSDSIDEERHSPGSSCASVDCAPVHDCDKHASANLIMGESVKSRDRTSVDHKVEFVNRNGDQKVETQLMSVNNVGDLKMESRFLDGDDEID